MIIDELKSYFSRTFSNINKMRVITALGIFTFLILLYETTTKTEESENEAEFIPTHEWQEVKKGQKVPRGLHVRMNFETGVTEAKLLGASSEQAEKTTSNKQQALVHVNQPPQTDDKEPKHFNPEYFKDSLKKIEEDIGLGEEDLKRVNKFKSYDELKKHLNELNVVPHTDAEIMKEIIFDLKGDLKNDELDRVRSGLEVLEVMCHQFDNALEFVRLDGFQSVIYKSLNTSNMEIRLATLQLMSSLTQNNPKVQIHALETGSIRTILAMLSLENTDKLQTKALTALGCLLRRFPLAQKMFLEIGGLPLLSKLFDLGSIKTQVKIATLLSDLVEEHNSAIEDQQNELLKQYDEINLEEKLTRNGWCENFNRLLVYLLIADINNHDSIDKCLLAMSSLAKECDSRFNKEMLSGLRDRYAELASRFDNGGENSGEYFRDIQALCEKLISKTSARASVKTEL